MKICKRGVDFIQITDAKGGVRVCCWMRDSYIGSLLESTLKEIYHSERAEQVRRDLLTYKNCQVDNCPYLANGTIDNHLVELNEIPEYPSELYLAYEGNCNYNCTCCTSFMNMKEAKEKNWNDNYDLIEQGIQEVLPHIKKISANGRGELFCSPRILKILHDWKPIHPKEQVCVALETNGSLFNETNWRKIENLGQYHLQVMITVMSFQEEIYQYLSGTKLPVSNIIKNLHFVKELRKKGIINEFEIATVLQEQNFREMPAFTERCLNEFGADTVRIRPIIPGGPLDRNVQWFMDVRNPFHPYYQEYKKIMEHPIFNHPKVLLWSGSCDSTIGEHPGIQAQKKLQKNQEVLNVIDRILAEEDAIKKLKDYMNQKNKKELSLYGIGRIGKLLLRLNGADEEIPIKQLYDNYTAGKSFGKHPILLPKDGDYQNSKNTAILVTVCSQNETIKQELEQYGFEGTILYVNS